MPWLRQRWQQWLDRRIPPTRQLILSHRSIFIVPTRSGWLFALILMVMLVTAINYQNSLIYGLTFWLFSLSLLAMLLTFRNLAHLTLSAAPTNACFAGEVMDLPLRLGSAQRRSHLSLWLAYPDNPSLVTDVGLRADHQESTVILSFRTQRRGYLTPGRFRISSQYPLGLFSAWSWVAIEYDALVYPKPEWTPLLLSAATGRDVTLVSRSHESGDQDFSGIRPYQTGDSMRQIAWKHVARGKGLVTKSFDREQGAQCILDWSSLAPADTETRLSRLCAWVLQAHEQGLRYGLRLPGVEIEPQHSEAHRQACLRTLALWGLPRTEQEQGS